MHIPSGTRLTTDAPVDNQGRGESFSPTDLVASGLGACMMTIMGIVAKRNGLRLEGTGIDIEKHMTVSPPRRLRSVVIRVRFSEGIPLSNRASLEQAARTCPVALSLHPDVTQEISFIYPD